ncbi:hypothetical protein [Agromyces sp. NPDC049794]|uniref:hypothetical protein n=1 Tax=unclassified Agromyces TaxID=2639701 RepID=UPI0033C5DF4A
MDRIYYAGDQFLTGTEIADALVAYAAALGRRGSTNSVEIPVRHPEDGRRGVVNFLIGPASQLVTERVGGAAADEIRDQELVKRLQQLTAELAPMHPITNRGVPDAERQADFDWTDEV